MLDVNEILRYTKKQVKSISIIMFFAMDFKWRIRMKIVDLFAGCGGMSLGFQNAGFNIVAAFEFWDVAVECYGKNFNHPVFHPLNTIFAKGLMAQYSHKDPHTHALNQNGAPEYNPHRPFFLPTPAP